MATAAIPVAETGRPATARSRRRESNLCRVGAGGLLLPQAFAFVRRQGLERLGRHHLAALARREAETHRRADHRQAAPPRRRRRPGPVRRVPSVRCSDAPARWRIARNRRPPAWGREIRRPARACRRAAVRHRRRADAAAQAGAASRSWARRPSRCAGCRYAPGARRWRCAPSCACLQSAGPGGTAAACQALRAGPDRACARARGPAPTGQARRRAVPAVDRAQVCGARVAHTLRQGRSRARP